MANGTLDRLVSFGTYLESAATNRRLAEQRELLADQLDATRQQQARQQQVEAQRQFVFELRRQLEQVEELAAAAPGEALLFRLDLEPMLGGIDESVLPEFRDKEYVHEVRNYARRVLDSFRARFGSEAVDLGIEYPRLLTYRHRLRLIAGLERAQATVRNAGMFSRGKAKAEALGVLRRYGHDERQLGQFEQASGDQIRAVIAQLRGMMAEVGYRTLGGGTAPERLDADGLDAEIALVEQRIRTVLDRLAAAGVISAGALEGG